MSAPDPTSVVIWCHAARPPTLFPMTEPAETLAILALALALDRILGDPERLWRSVPHPAALLGMLVDALDRNLNDPARTVEARRQRGIWAVAILAVGAAFAGWVLSAIAAAIPLGWVLQAAILAVLVAQKSLIDHVAAVAHALTNGLESGRIAVAKIVGREVAGLDEAGVARAAIESLAENFSDGVVAPAFWFLLFGLPGVLVYKAVNTADSMIGNRSPRHAAFGWAAARLDDLLNLAPSRLSALIIVAAARLLDFDAAGAAASARRDARKHRSPNAGWPEAAAAGALGLAFGGPRRYGPVEVDGAWINPQGRDAARPQDIGRAIRLIDAAWALLAVVPALAAAAILLAIWR